MSENERPPGTAHLSPDDWHELLEVGAVEVLGRMPWSSNVTLLVSLSVGDHQAQAIYKPGTGERELWDFPDGLFRREVAAYELSEALGLGVVPVTVLREDGPYGEGSFQAYVDADFEQHYFTMLKEPRLAEQLRFLAGYDILANNVDRKGGHLLIDREDCIFGIDNGLCFHPEPKLRTVMWDFAGEEIPPAVLEAGATLLEGLPERLTALLSPIEQAALVERVAAMIAMPLFPTPRDDHRCYPWPLV